MASILFVRSLAPSWSTYFFFFQSIDKVIMVTFFLLEIWGKSREVNKCERGLKTTNSTQILMTVGENVYGAILDLKKVQATS